VFIAVDYRYFSQVPLVWLSHWTIDYFWLSWKLQVIK
jgi:hypothetical protein